MYRPGIGLQLKKGVIGTMGCLSVLCFAMSTATMAVDIAPAATANQPILQPELAARINTAPVYKLTLDVLASMAQLEKPKTGRADILDSIVSNRLLAGDVRGRFAEEELQQSRRVAFEP